MTLFAVAQHILRLLKRESEPTMMELLSNSVVKAVMEADGVDPLMLEAQLRDMATELTLARHTNRNCPRAHEPGCSRAYGSHRWLKSLTRCLE